MEFFERPKIVEVAESHAASAKKLSDEASARVIDSYRRVRQDLRDRLETIPSGTFTAQRARSTVVQIDAALKAMNTNLFDDMDSAAQESAELGIEHLIAEIEKWDDEFVGTVSELSIDVVESATNTKKLLINNYKSSINSYSSALRGRLSQGIGDGVIAQSTTGEIMNTIGKTLLGDQWRLERIVRTEILGIYSRGKLNAMTDLTGDIPDLMKTVYNPMDSRTAKDSIYVEKLVEGEDPRMIIPVDDYFEYTWKKKKRKYLAPPDRPNDRSILIPYRKAWEK